MDLNSLKKFAQGMRRDLVSQMDARIEYVLKQDDEYLRALQAEKNKVVELEKTRGRSELAEEAAYLWFNRLAAFRYMDSRGYTSPRLVSPRIGESQPELLAEIKQGRTPTELASRVPQFDAILSGRIKAAQPDREVYQEAILGTCNAWATRMPWLFTKVDDWASLLLPQDLLSGDSLIARMVAGLSDTDCAEGVEIIGWLYQFYISEKKDEVFALLKKNVKIAKENIPAATQLFTPHWIVRFMVENTLGRLWLLNRPESRLKERMKYFVESDPEPDFLKVKDPTELKCLDPCCGSGHILAYFFELLYAIYEEEGYAPQEIPSLIIEKNIYGIDIDERAAELAAFTLAMVAREKDKRFFERGIQPNVIAMRDANVNLKKLGVRLSPDLQESVELLKEGRNYGSLIPVPAGAAGEIHEVEAGIDAHRFDDLFGAAELEELRVAFRILEYLEPRYQVVVTNPPYMGGKGMNDRVKQFVEGNFPSSKADLGAVFIERSLTSLVPGGYASLITRQSWMFLSSYQYLRAQLINSSTLALMTHLGSGAFETIGGEVVQATTFVIKNSIARERKGTYIKINAGKRKIDHEAIFLEILGERNKSSYFLFWQKDFLIMPGFTIAYWMNKEVLSKLSKSLTLESYAPTLQGIATGNNGRYIRYWAEISTNKLSTYAGSVQGAQEEGKKWLPFNKGGEYRKWYGNHDYVIAFDKKSRDELKLIGNHLPSEREYCKPCINWTAVTSRSFSCRYLPRGFIFSNAGMVALPKPERVQSVLALLNSTTFNYLVKLISQTMNYNAGEIETVKMIENDMSCRNCLSISRSDWDSRETSWDFLRSPLLTDYLAPRISFEVDADLTSWSWPRIKEVSLSRQIEIYKQHWTKMFNELLGYENAINAFFSELYGLGNELSVDDEAFEISILQEEAVASERKLARLEFIEGVLIEQFVSYGVGCLMGRYSVEKDGLILSASGTTLSDFGAAIPGALYVPDNDGIIPLTDEDDFADDLPTAFKVWLRFISGDHYDDNLRLLEKCFGESLRYFFAKGFYLNHLKRYKSRPVYWMVSSPSGAFRALIYLHRYTKDTVGKILNDYVRPYRTKIDQKISGLELIIDSSGSSAGEKTKAKKRLAQLEKYQIEIEAWEKVSLYPLALKRVELDLDDGVKVNYRKLEGILEPVKQLEAKEEE